MTRNQQHKIQGDLLIRRSVQHAYQGPTERKKRAEITLHRREPHITSIV